MSEEGIPEERFHISSHESTNREVGILTTGSPSPIDDITRTQNGLFAISNDAILVSWEFKDDVTRLQNQEPLSNTIRLPSRQLSLTSFGDYVCLGATADDGLIRVFDTSRPRNPAFSNAIPTNSGSVFALVHHRESLVAGMGEGNLGIWRTSDWKQTGLAAVQEYFVLSVEADDEFVYGGGTDKSISILDQSNLQSVSSLVGHDASVLCLAVDDEHLYSGSGEIWWGGPGSPRPPEFESAIRVWEKGDWTCLALLDGHSDNVNAICVDKSRIYSVSDDGTLRVYKKDEWSETDILKIRSARPTSLCQDRSALYIGCSDGAVRWVLKNQLNG
jgi:hypothetical protein